MDLLMVAPNPRFLEIPNDDMSVLAALLSAASEPHCIPACMSSMYCILYHPKFYVVNLIIRAKMVILSAMYFCFHVLLMSAL